LKRSTRISILSLFILAIFLLTGFTAYMLIDTIQYPATISAGYDYSLFINDELSLWGYGSNKYAVLGNPILGDRASPVLLAEDVVFISAGDFHTVYIKESGGLWGFGSNAYLALGGSNKGLLTQTRLLPRAIFACAGPTYTLAIDDNNTLKCWGFLNGVSISNFSVSDVKAVSSGFEHILILKTDGTLWTTGNNNYGQLGTGDALSHNSPVQILSGITKISAGLYHSMALKDDGTLYTWGLNGMGQLGINSTTDTFSPTALALVNTIEISAGNWHSAAITDDTTLYTWGLNDSGQLGINSTTDSLVPTSVDNGVIKVSTGTFHTLYLKGDQTLWHTGSNQLTPVQTAANVKLPSPITFNGEEITFGDINDDGVVNILDLINLAQKLAGIIELTEYGKAAADVNHDGAVDILDLIKLAQHLAGIVNNLDI